MLSVQPLEYGLQWPVFELGRASGEDHRLHTALTSKPAPIKEWVSTKGPVSACFVVYQDFFSYKSGIYRHVTGNQAGGHCVTIIGYNDSPGYWICKNSWNTNWLEWILPHCLCGMRD